MEHDQSLIRPVEDDMEFAQQIYTKSNQQFVW